MSTSEGASEARELRSRAENWEERLDELDELRRGYQAHGSARAKGRHTGRGKLLARERVERLCDADSFVELGALAHEAGRTTGVVADPQAPADGVITGVGTVAGRTVCVQADDGTVYGGARGAVGARKVERLKRLSIDKGYPYVALLEGSAGRIQENIGATSASVGAGFRTQMELRAAVPTVAAVMGKCFGGPAFYAALSDYVPMVEGTGFLAMSGPSVIRAGTGQQVTEDEIGGPAMQAAGTGMVDHVAVDDDACLESIREFLGYLGPATTNDPADRSVPELTDVVPAEFTKPYDMREVLRALLDDGRFLELEKDHAANLLTCLGRMDGTTVGVVASQPKRMAGILDTRSAAKAKGFLELCRRRRLPVVFLQDVPGFIVGVDAERQGQVQLAADLLCAVADVPAPKVTVILRKAFGLSYLALGGRSMGADFVYAWPGAEIGLMGPGAAARTILGPEATADELDKATEDYRRLMSPYIAAGEAYIDDVIAPADTRRVVCQALRLAGAE